MSFSYARQVVRSTGRKDVSVTDEGGGTGDTMATPTVDSPGATPRPRSRGGPVLIGALVVDALGNGLFMPLSLVYFTALTDVPLALLGTLLSVANLITLPVPVWAGALADRVGALPLVIGSQVVQAAGFVAYGWVSEPVGILVAATLVAVGVRFFWSSVFTALADYADGGAATVSKDSWFAWSNMTRTGGLALGGLVTGVAIADGSASGYRAIAYVTAACFLAAALALALFVRAPRVLPDTPPATTSGYRTLLRDGPFLGLTGVNTVYAMSSMMLGLAMPTFVLHGLRGPAWLTSLLLVGSTVLITLLTAPTVRRLAPFRRTRSLMVAAGLWVAWCLVLAALAPGHRGWLVVALVGATLLFTLAEVIHAPVSMALAASAAPAEFRGRYLATYQYSFTVAGIVAPAFFTTLFELHRSMPWLALGVINAASIGAVLLLERRLPAAALRDAPRETA